MNGKSVAVVVLLLIIFSSFVATAAVPTILNSNISMSIQEMFDSTCMTTVVYADPVGGGPGGGGDH